MKDLGAILSPFAKPSINLSAVPGLEIYEGVTYLMPYEQAKKALNLNQRVVPKNKVNCPGFPKDSFFHYAFDGTFEGHFNKLYIVTDKADQVVAIQFVAESPKRENVEAPNDPTDAHTYNFINYRGKGTKRLWVEHIAYFQDKKGNWRRYRNPSRSSYDQPEGPVDILRIDSLLMDPDASSSGFRRNNWKPLEAVRLYLPKPMMELILQCVNSPAR